MRSGHTVSTHARSHSLAGGKSHFRWEWVHGRTAMLCCQQNGNKTACLDMPPRWPSCRRAHPVLACVQLASAFVRPARHYRPMTANGGAGRGKDGQWGARMGSAAEARSGPPSARMLASPRVAATCRALHLAAPSFFMSRYHWRINSLSICAKPCDCGRCKGLCCSPRSCPARPCPHRHGAHPAGAGRLQSGERRLRSAPLRRAARRLEGRPARPRRRERVAYRHGAPS